MSKLGLPGADLGETNDRFDLKNAETIALMGGQPGVVIGRHHDEQLRPGHRGRRPIVYVGPSYNATAAYFDARWIPIYPGTDTAFLLGVAYEMIQQDVVDRDFLNTYCVGFDGDHMPSDAKLDENFQGYLMGDYDGVPKTAAWASAICGATEEDIAWFAGTIGKDRKVMLLHNYALARCASADQRAPAVHDSGRHGRSYGQIGTCMRRRLQDVRRYAWPSLAAFGETGLPVVENPITECISAPLLWQSMLDGSFNSTGMAYSDEFNAQDIKQADISICRLRAQRAYRTRRPL